MGTATVLPQVEIMRETLTLTAVQSAKVKGYEGDPCHGMQAVHHGKKWHLP